MRKQIVFLIILLMATTASGTLNTNIYNGGQLRFWDTGNSNYVGFAAPALTANTIWTLWIADGNNGDVPYTNGAGILSWKTAGGAETDPCLALLDINSVDVTRWNTALTTATSWGGDLSGTGTSPSVTNDSHNHTATTISGLGVADFTSANVSQWTNDSGYLTAEVDGSITNELQNIFQTITVAGQSNVVADSTTDTLTLTAGTNITLTTNATTDTVTITAAGSVAETDPCYALLSVVDLLTFSANVLDVNTATPANGDTKHLATGDQIYDFVTGLGYITGNQTITLSGDVTGSGTTAITAAVVNDSHNHTASTISGLDVNDFDDANVSQFTNDSGYLTAETAESDPCWAASPSYHITEANITDWEAGGAEIDPCWLDWYNSGSPTLTGLTVSGFSGLLPRIVAADANKALILTNISTWVTSGDGLDSTLSETGVLSLKIGWEAISETKGMIIVFNGDVWMPLYVGNNDEVLAADSSEPNGIKWAVCSVSETDPCLALLDINSTDVTRWNEGGGGDVNMESHISLVKGSYGTNYVGVDVNVVMTDGGTIGQTDGVILTFDDTNDLFTVDSNTVISGTLTVDGDQTGATDSVFDTFDDIGLLRKWRNNEQLPFKRGDILNQNRLLRDAILQLEARIRQLEKQK